MPYGPTPGPNPFRPFLANGSVQLSTVQGDNAFNQLNLNDQSLLAWLNATDARVDNGTWKNWANVAAPGNINIASAPAAIDGVTLAVGDRALLPAQGTGTQNGLYTFAGAGVAMTRALDAASGAALWNCHVPIAFGTSAGKVFYNTNATLPVLGTDTPTFTVAASGSGTGIKQDIFVRLVHGSNITITTTMAVAESSETQPNTSGEAIFSSVFTPTAVGTLVTVVVNIESIIVAIGTGTAAIYLGGANSVCAGSCSITAAYRGTLNLGYQFTTVSLTPITISVRFGYDATTGSVSAVASTYLHIQEFQP